MRYAIYPINPRKSYGITIGSRAKPDSEFRALVKGQIERAMGAFERDENQSHSIAIVPDWDTAEFGLPEVPTLSPREQYLIFAIFYSPNPDSAESLSTQELEFYREEIGAMLEGVLGPTRAALVLLRDCSVSVMETDKTDNWLSW